MALSQNLLLVSQVGPDPPALLISDHCVSHYRNGEHLGALRTSKTNTVFIPPGCTSFLQWLDVQSCAMQSRLHALLWGHPVLLQRVTASQRRVLMTRWVGEAYEEALGKLNVPGGFTSLGYLYVDDTSYQPKIRDMGYQFSPSQFPVLPRSVAPPKPAAKRQRQPRLEEMFSR